MKSKSGFTIIELMMAVSIVALLSGITVLAYIAVQKDARDATRKNVALIVSEGLEKYYDANGEYPSMPSLTNTLATNTGTKIASILKIPNTGLKMPKMPSTATNPITSDSSPHDDYISYTTDNTKYNLPAEQLILDSCTTSSTGGCRNFILKYIKEDGSTISISSRR
jgi:prepilin-type N-terminal cleavage/methylation domain-containing protein